MADGGNPLEKWRRKRAHYSAMHAIAVIPARLASTRLPRKLLLPLHGRPLLGHVYEAARRSPLLADVVIATDAEEILELCRAHGWQARLTSAKHRSGTDRVHEIACPAIVFHGTSDLSIEIGLGEQLCERLPDCRGLIRIEGAPHASNMTHPDQVNGPLLEFLRSL